MIKPSALIVCGLAFFTGSTFADEVKDLNTAQCLELKSVQVSADKIALPTHGVTITSAAIAGKSDQEHCQLDGVIKSVDPKAPNIEFQVNFPRKWNGKALQLGGGGFNGAIRGADTARFAPTATPSALQQGYVTFGSDSGHQGEITDASFALNDEAWQNFAGAQLKKTHDVAVALIQQIYKTTPKRMYFQGNSQGGHEALAVIQRYPLDYDGVIAIHPVYNLTELHLVGALIGQAIYNTPGAWISPYQAALISKAVYAVCDKLDGVKDGVIANVKACDAQFKLDSLRCIAGKNSGENCLSDTQLSLVRKLSQSMPLGVTLPTGNHFAPWPILQGADASTLASTFGTQADKPKITAPVTPAVDAGEQKGEMPAPTNIATSFPYIMGDQMVRYEVMRDPQYDTLAFDPASHAARLKELAAQVDDANPDIRIFQQHGGKLLLMHGTVDMAVPPANSIAYYEKLKDQFGESKLHDFVRFYLAPGFGHGGGPFLVSWDSLGTLDNWVDKGIAPGPQKVVDTNEATAGREMPLCEYPQHPQYQGTGSTTSASNFKCVSN